MASFVRGFRLDQVTGQQPDADDPMAGPQDKNKNNHVPDRSGANSGREDTMNTTSLLKTFGSALLLFGLVSETMPSAQAQGRAVKRDLQEWLDAQGTAYGPHPLAPQSYSIWSWMNYPDLNNDGELDGVWYDLWYDYAGVLGRADSYLGGALGPKSITGTVTERPIGNGMAEVTVRAKVAGALIWVVAHSCCWEPFLKDLPTVFGHRETEIAANPSLPAARTDVDFTVTFLNEVGGEMPDLNTSWEQGRFSDSEDSTFN
ncbi:MAG: hypothetical protein ACKV0T_00295 [Planctomycetales bacterium]